MPDRCFFTGHRLERFANKTRACSSLRDKGEANAFFHERDQFSKCLEGAVGPAAAGHDTKPSQHAETRDTYIGKRSIDDDDAAAAGRHDRRSCMMCSLVTKQAMGCPRRAAETTNAVRLPGVGRGRVSLSKLRFPLLLPGSRD